MLTAVLPCYFTAGQADAFRAAYARADAFDVDMTGEVYTSLEQFAGLPVTEATHGKVHGATSDRQILELLRPARRLKTLELTSCEAPLGPAVTYAVRASGIRRLVLKACFRSGDHVVHPAVAPFLGQLRGGITRLDLDVGARPPPDLRHLPLLKLVLSAGLITRCLAGSLPTCLKTLVLRNCSVQGGDPGDGPPILDLRPLGSLECLRLGGTKLCTCSGHLLLPMGVRSLYAQACMTCGSGMLTSAPGMERIEIGGRPGRAWPPSFARSMETMPGVRWLALIGVGMTDALLGSFLEAAASARQLVHLDLSGNSLRNQVEKLARILNDCPVRKLVLSNTKLPLDVFGGMEWRSQTLRQLRLGWKPMTGWAAALRAALARAPLLESLVVTHMTLDEAMPATQVKELVLAGCKVSAQSALELADAPGRPLGGVVSGDFVAHGLVNERCGRCGETFAYRWAEDLGGFIDRRRAAARLARLADRSGGLPAELVLPAAEDAFGFTRRCLAHGLTG